MKQNIIMLIAVIAILILVTYLMQDSGVFDKLRKNIKNLAKKIYNNKNMVEVVNAPVIYVKNPKDKNYYKVQMLKKEFKIGTGSRNDLKLDDKKVEETHAVILKKIKKDRVYYELINYAKVNPIEYYNKIKDGYEYMRYKDGIKLEAREGFYVGDTKIIISIPTANHEPSFTERIENDSGNDEYTNYLSSEDTVRYMK